MNLKLHLTDDTQLHAHGFIAGSDLFAEVCWKRPIPDSRLDEGCERVRKALVGR